MPEDQLIFDLPEGVYLQDLENWLQEKRPVKGREQAEVRRVYYDTFDWRLLNAGSVLEISTEKPGYLLTWRELGGGRLLAQTSIRQIPRFAGDFLAPGLRTRLQQVLGTRTLMPKATINSSTSELRLLNEDDKTLMRIELRQDHAVPTQGTKLFKLPDAIYLFPLRGFDAVYAETARVISGKGKLRAIGKDPLISALHSMGMEAGSYTGSPEFHFDPKQPAFEALCRVLDRHRLIMEENLAGVCEDKDPEFLHDFLHSTRRSQCLLRQHSGLFPAKPVHLIRQDFDWLEKITTPVRSLDIYLGLFDEFVTRVDTGHRLALEPLKRFLQAEKRREHRLMRVPLESPRYRRTMESWKRILNDKALSAGLPADARRPILEVASEGIYSLYMQLIEKGRGVGGQDSPGELLGLQIIGKRLGYELETFHTLYPREQIAPALAALRQLQKNLNTFHNLHLQHGSLLDYSSKMQQQIRTMPVWLEAIELLAADREQEEHKMQAEFSACYNRLAQKKCGKDFVPFFPRRRIR